MLKSLKDLMDRLFAAPGAAAAADDEHLLQLGTAVMLVEVMRADGSFAAGERERVHAALRSQFGLSADEAERLAELGAQEARQATDLFTFTSRINERFDMAQKLRMVEHMWSVAYADGHLGEHERHVMWRIADLLHVPQGAYVNARLRAQKAAGPAPG
jgi:uncharacterized tellurite resistance protein B-like protein